MQAITSIEGMRPAPSLFPFLLVGLWKEMGWRVIGPIRWNILRRVTTQEGWTQVPQNSETAGSIYLDFCVRGFFGARDRAQGLEDNTLHASLGLIFAIGWSSEYHQIWPLTPNASSPLQKCFAINKNNKVLYFQSLYFFFLFLFVKRGWGKR